MKVENCRNCGAEIAVQEGRRKREFCDNKGKCKYEWHKKNKPKEKTYNGHKIEAGKAYILKDGKPIELTTPEGVEKLKEVGLIPKEAVVVKKDNPTTPDNKKKTFQEILNMAKAGESWGTVDAEIQKVNLSPNQVQMIFSKIKQ